MNTHYIFFSKMQELLHPLGVSNTNHLTYSQQLSTKYGKLYIHVSQTKSKLYSCYCQFDDVDKAKNHMGCIRFNRFSGKWNFHVPVKNNDPEQVAKEIVKEIQTVL